jgi:competence protein ComEA
MNLWHQFLSSYFGFNKQQRNGLFVLVLLIISLFIVRLSISHFIKPEPLLMLDVSKMNLPEANSVTASADSSKTNGNSENNLFVFDPNTATKEQLVKLGFKEKTAGTLINYRSKGGQFRKKEDLKKVYGLSERLYLELEPFILVPGEKKKFEKNEKFEKFEKTGSPAPSAPTAIKSKIKIELNSADSLQLLSLNGVGPAFTKRILKYRSLLGGFVNIEQLREVFGMDDELFQKIKAVATVNSSSIKKIDLNNPNFKELNKHPYLSYDDVKAIFNYRRESGPIKDMEDVRSIFLDETALNKLLPYLELK